MEHLAIIRQPFLDMMLSGKKTIESRWHKSKKAPFGMISAGDRIYLKEPGRPVIARAEVKKTLFFDNLDEGKITEIVEKYGSKIGINASYVNKIKDKKFCTLVFIKNTREINPFGICKRGYGNMAAWITLKNISEIRIK